MAAGQPPLRAGLFLRAVAVRQVKDVAASVACFGQALGFRAARPDEPGCGPEAPRRTVVERDGVEVHLVLDQNPPGFSLARAGTGALCLKVEDIGEAFAEAWSRGVLFACGIATET
jgi:hypothetical protein